VCVFVYIYIVRDRLWGGGCVCIHMCTEREIKCVGKCACVYREREHERERESKSESEE